MVVVGKVSSPAIELTKKMLNEVHGITKRSGSKMLFKRNIFGVIFCAFMGNCSPDDIVLTRYNQGPPTFPSLLVIVGRDVLLEHILRHEKPNQ